MIMRFVWGIERFFFSNLNSSSSNFNFFFHSPQMAHGSHLEWWKKGEEIEAEMTSEKSSIAAYRSAWITIKRWFEAAKRKRLPNRNRRRSRDLHNFIQSRSMTRTLFANCCLSCAVLIQFIAAAWLEFDGRADQVVESAASVFCSTSRSLRTSKKCAPVCSERRFFFDSEMKCWRWLVRKTGNNKTANVWKRKKKKNLIFCISRSSINSF